MVHPRCAEVSALGRRALGSARRRLGRTPPAPDRTGFYAPVDPGPGRRGEVLATEPLPVDLAATGHRVRYRSLDASGRPVATSMAVAVPTATTGGRRPVVVWVHGAGGVAAGCGPSRVGFDAWYATELVAAGAVVAAPDLLGLGMDGPVHPYRHGTTAAHGVLDAARAAAELAGAGPVTALAGHSAGGFAVLWANQLTAGPDGAGLDVRLAVPMSPVADLAVAMAHFATGRDRAAFPVQLAATWSSVEPVDLTAVLTPGAIRRSDHLWHDRLARLLQVYRGDPSRWVRAEAFAHGEWAAALARQSAGRAPGAAPVVLVHGEDDGDVPVRWTKQLAAGLDDAELLIYPGADHMSIADAARADVVSRLLAAVS
jgi:dienelactone hydrolase